MSWTNYHSHSYYCDGKEAPESHLKAALTQGMHSFGFSSHAPLPFPTSWAMPDEKLEDYVSETKALQDRFRGQIELYVGLEVDFIPGFIGPSSSHIVSAKLDYTVGSVHYVDRFADGRHWEIDGPHSVFLEGLADIFNGDARAAVERYFELTREMLRTDCPSVLGHMDKIKMQSESNHLFDTRADWYREQVTATLESAREAGCIIELNTRGGYKGRDGGDYPANWMLESIRSMGIPLCLNSDSHHPRELSLGFESAAARLQTFGFEELWALSEGDWQAYSFDQTGLKGIKTR